MSKYRLVTKFSMSALATEYFIQQKVEPGSFFHGENKETFKDGWITLSRTFNHNDAVLAYTSCNNTKVTVIAEQEFSDEE
jgi:hypothetical protein